MYLAANTIASECKPNHMENVPILSGRGCFIFFITSVKCPQCLPDVPPVNKSSSASLSLSLHDSLFLVLYSKGKMPKMSYK